MKTSACLLFLLLLVSEGLAFNEPDGLQMLKFGQDVRKALPKCDTLTLEEKWQKPCWRNHDIWLLDESKLMVQNITVGETSLKIKVEQIDEKLEMISATFPGGRFNELAAAMQSRYGKPTSSKAVVYQNSFGTKFEYPRHAWIGKKVHITMEHAPLSGKDTIGLLTYRTSKYVGRGLAEEAQKVNKTAKDL